MSPRTFFLRSWTALALAGFAAAQQDTGAIVRFKKISEIMGVFDGGLDVDDQMGRAVIAPGDIDGDGNCDLVSGAIGDDDGGTQGLASDTGALWVHFLTANGGLFRNAKISATKGGLVAPLDTRDQLGRALESLGDFDHDGVPDIAVGACRDDDGGSNRGAIYLLYLNRDGSVKRQSKISDTAGNFQGVLEDLDEFGRAIANLGDLDGNGVIDLAVGATGDDDGGVDLKGAVWILFLQADGTVLREQKISDTAGNFLGILGGGDMFGHALASLGDLDGDGVGDLAVGTPKDDDGGVRKGAVWILFLKRDGTVKGFKKISDVGDSYGLYGGDEFGSSIAGLGDMDGDGIPDMAVGAILDDGSLKNQGAVWLNFMNRDGTVRAKRKINDLSPGFEGRLGEEDWFGSSVYRIPDLDGNGVAELAVGARFDDDGGAGTGSVWVLFLAGAVNTPPTAHFVVDPAIGNAPLKVLFNERCSAGAHTYAWDFGDGTSSTLTNPGHIYTAPGLYSVSLAVSGPGGSAGEVQHDLVLVREAASATERNGSGANALCYHTLTPPVLGDVWRSEVDATHHAGAGLTMLMLTIEPLPGAMTPLGELLVKSPSVGGEMLLRLYAPSGGGVAHHALAVPADATLVGRRAYTQALILGGGHMELCNAIDLVLGY